MPDMDNMKGAIIQSLMDECMMAIAIGNNGKNYVLGVSEKYMNENTDGAVRNQTFASMTALEGTTGAAYNDDSGWTVTLACKTMGASKTIYRNYYAVCNCGYLNNILIINLKK